MTPEKLRELLDAYDAGTLTEGELSGHVFKNTVDYIVESVKDKKPIWMFGSVCRAKGSPPPEKLSLQIVFGEDLIIINPVQNDLRSNNEQ